MINLDTKIEEVPNIGPAYRNKLKKLGIKTIQDLLFYFPARYEDFSNIIPIEEVRKKKTKCVSIDLLTAGLDLELLKQLKEVLGQHKGAVPVYLNFKDTSGRTTILDSGGSYQVDTSDEFFERLEKLLGANTVKIRC